GGRGIAAKIAWDSIKPGIDAFDPENRLIIMTGPLTGTLAPTSGRISFSGVSPQAYPKPWYTRSNMGGWFGSELKYAGYDGLVLVGKSKNPTYLWIHDESVEFCNAKDVWGRDTFSTQKYFMDNYPEESKVICIGPAGENKVRYGIIQSETENAAGQGGFGAVLGSKNLKAIIAKGSGAVAIAQPNEFRDLCLAINKDFQRGPGERHQLTMDPELVKLYGGRRLTCTHACPWGCARIWRNVPGKAYPGVNTTVIQCVAGLFAGIPNVGQDKRLNFYDWNLGFEAGVEISAVANKLGLNHWSLILGLVPWLRECKEKGLIKEIDGIPIDFGKPEFWVTLLHKIAYREGIGDILAEEVPRASDKLNMGKDIVEKLYPAYGFAGHWDGRGDKANTCTFPTWIVSALQWTQDTRDPFNSGHDYSQNVGPWSKALTWDKFNKLGEKIYGSEKAVNPEYPYEYKAQPTIYTQHESILKDSLLLCDQAWPRFYSTHVEDGYARVSVSELGIIYGKSFEYYLYKTATGVQTKEEDFWKCSERAFNLERAIQIRNDSRRREDDMKVFPYFEMPESLPGD
ncbi:hypothetical protein MUP37_06350, partial [Candidatus Bathyarchaeota archaeon]|nr:hypothetical protein [Candidatus Bathyarchaeota archaeon]